MPLSKEDLAQLEKPKRTLIIICAALINGAVAFGIVLCTVLDFGNLNTELGMLVSMAAGFGMVNYMASFVAFQVLSAHTHAKTESLPDHFRVLQTAWIVRFALIEGACFLNLIVTMLQDSLITLFVAVLGVLLMLIGFPLASRIEAALEKRLGSR